MRPVLALVQIIQGALGDNLHLEVQILLQHLLQVQHLWLPVHQCQHGHAHRILQLGIAEQLVPDDLRNGVLFQLDDDPHAGTVGLIPQVVNAVNALVLHQIRNALNEPCLVDHVGDLVHDDAVSPLDLLKGGVGTEGQLCPSGGVCRPDGCSAHEDAPGGEIRPLDMLHQIVQGTVRIVDQGADAINDLPQIVGRNVGCHTHGNAHGAVHQQVREPGGQHHRLLEPVVVVGHEGYRVLADVRQHLHSDFRHSRFRITICRRRISVHGAEVAVAVHQRIPQREGLRQPHQCVIHGGVSVRMVPAQHGAHRIGAFSVCLVRGQSVFVEGVQDPAVYGLQPVPHIRQRPGHDHGHGIFDKGFFHFLFDIHGQHNFSFAEQIDQFLSVCLSGQNCRPSFSANKPASWRFSSGEKACFGIT